MSRPVIQTFNAPKAEPRPPMQKTRDLILMILRGHFDALSTRSILDKLRKLGPYTTIPDRTAMLELRKQLDALRRIGHIKLEDSGDTGAHWAIVPGFVTPKHRAPAAHAILRDWVKTMLEQHGPLTAHQLAELASTHKTLAKHLNDHSSTRLASALVTPVKNGELLAEQVRFGDKAVYQYRLPGTAAVPLAIKRKSKLPVVRTRELTALQHAILKRLKKGPATAPDLTPYLIKAKHIRPSGYDSRAVGSACMGLVRRGLVIADKSKGPTVYKLAP